MRWTIERLKNARESEDKVEFKRAEVIEEAIQIGLETMAKRNGLKSVQNGAQNGVQQGMLPLES